MRRLVAALVMATLALVLVACGADTSATPTGTPVSGSVVAPGSVTATASRGGTDTHSPPQRTHNQPDVQPLHETAQAILADPTDPIPNN